MTKPFLTDEARRALSEAVRTVEANCSAELVVAVRARSGSYLHADLIGAIGSAVAVLLFLLFSPWPFGLAWFVIDPVLVGILGGLAVSRSPALRRALTRPELRRRQVEVLAKATFLEKRVHQTTGRTGILLYLSALEREAEVVVDLGVEPLATTEGWKHAVENLRTAVRNGADGVETAQRIVALGAILAPALIRSADDVDELPNEVSDR